MDRIENDASNNSSIVSCVFVVAVIFLPSRFLATIGGYTYRRTDWWERFMKYAVEMGTCAMTYISCLSRAIAQAVSHQLPTTAARIRVEVRSCGICGRQSGTEAGFLRVLRFLLPILIPPSAPHSSSIIRSWYSRPVSGWRTRWTQFHPNPRN
jgi:hypothetical protein